ncbi:MAG: diguanylate cyclase [Candidatus Sericytochromatia bacterium]|nr:diguanylate cyclase [Candidatus Sericytochromatia bacterium]
MPSSSNQPNYLAKIYFWSVFVVGIFAFIFSILFTHNSLLTVKNFWEFIFFVTLNILAEVAITRIPTGGSLTASFSIILTVLLVQGPIYAIISSIIGSSISILLQKRKLKIALFNSALFSIIFFTAGISIDFLHNIFKLTGRDLIFSLMVLAFVVTSIYMILSSLIVNTYICITTKAKFFATLKEDRWEFTQLVILTPISVLGVYFYYSIGIFATLAVFFPAIITVYSIKSYINMNHSNSELKSFNENLEQLYEITKKISQQNIMKNLWRMLSSETRTLIPYDRCGIYLINKELTHLNLVAGDMAYNPSESYDLLKEGPLQNSLAKRTFLIDNNFNAPYLYHNWGIFKSILAEPIIVDGEVMGLMCLLSTERDTFNFNHSKFIKLLLSSVENTIKSINLYEQTQKQALIDGLTGLYNQKYFKSQVEAELKRAHQNKLETSVIMFDADYFKKFNDTHGHLLGDLVLKDLARIVKSFAKSNYVASRYGGEEFALLLPETKLEEACEIAEAIRKKVRENKFVGREQREVSLSISIGVNSHNNSQGDVTKIEFIDRADTALYRAKNEGRNRVYKAIYVLDKDQLIVKNYTKDELTEDKKNLYVFTLDKQACAIWKSFFEKFDTWINSEENIHLKNTNPDYQIFFINLIINKLDSPDKKINVENEYDIERDVISKLYFPTDFYKFEIEIEELEKNLFDYIATLKTAEIEKEYIRKIIIVMFNKVYAMAIKYTSNHYQKIIDFHTNIAHINSELGSISTKQAFYTNITKLTSEIIDAKFAFISELEPYKKNFKIKAFYGANEFKLFDSIENTELIMEGISNKIINYGEVIQINEDEIKDAFSDHVLQILNIKSAMLIPLVRRDKQVIGVLVCLDDKARIFKFDEIKICQEIAERVVKASTRIEKNALEKGSYIEIIKSMIDIHEARNPISKDHSKNVSRLAGKISNALEIPKEEQNEIRIAAYLHDIGNIGLFSEKNIDEEALRAHSLIGARIVSMVPDLKDLAPAIKHHHENWDGSGYPDGLEGTSIPLYARIIAIANKYDEYFRKYGEHSLTIQKMKESNLFDPEICKIIEAKSF